MARRVSGFTLVAGFALAACSPDPITSINAPSSPSFARSVGQSARHIVLLNGNTGADALSARVTALGGSVTSFHQGAGFAVVSGLTAAAATKLAASGIADVYADFPVSLNVPVPVAEADVSEVTTEVNSQANPATGARYPWQWNMQLIQASAAWAAGKLGSPDVTVAILDSGIDYTAPDLAGLVDLSRSKSYMNNFVGLPDDLATPEQDGSPIIPSDDAIIGAAFPTRNLIDDLNGHGTNVATQVSSKAPVHAGVTSKTTLIAVKVTGANGYGDFSDIMEGVLFAADNGADVANMSLGAEFGRSHNGLFIGAVLNRIFNYARQQGMVIVVAAGNSGSDLQHNGNTYSTFCDAPHVICVSSVGPRLGGSAQNQDEPAYYTNFGPGSVDIAAPGGNADAANHYTVSNWPWGADIASWVWSYCARERIVITRVGTTANGSWVQHPTCRNGNRVSGFIGTSQAATHVAGLAALLVAEYGKDNPEWIKQRIQLSSDPVDPAVGRGRINVKNALGL